MRRLGVLSCPVLHFLSANTRVYIRKPYSRSSLVSSSLLNLLCLDSSPFLITPHFLSFFLRIGIAWLPISLVTPKPTANTFPRGVLPSVRPQSQIPCRTFWQRLLTALIYFLHCQDVSYLLFIAKRRHITTELKKSCQKTFCRRL